MAAPTGFIHADGKRLVDGSGATFVVKGINLGNWLVPEGYMFKFKRALSPTEIARVFDTLIGPEAAARFWSQFRDVYVSKDDIDFIKAAGFNTVRVPLDWRLFVEPGDPGSGMGVIASTDRAGLCSTGWCSGAATPACGRSSICMPRPGARPGSITTTAPAFR